MKLNQFLFFIILLCVVSLAEQAHAQVYGRFTKKKRYWSYGGMLNVMNYVGDLDPGQSPVSPALKFTRHNIGIVAQYRLYPRITIRGALSWGRIKGDDQVSTQNNDDRFRFMRNLSFRSNIYELKADVVIDLFENRGDYKHRVDYTPYIFFGVAYFHHNPKANYDGRWISLRRLRTENVNYSLHQISIPFGVGFRYKINAQFDLAFEIGWRKTFTDYLDDVSGDYVAQDKLSSDLSRQLADRSDEVAFTDKNINGVGPYIMSDGSFSSEQKINGYGNDGDQRGDKTDKDYYIVTGFHLTYIIPQRVICPKFK